MELKMMGNDCGELLSQENISCGKFSQERIELVCAQDREEISPERGLLMSNEADLARALNKIGRLNDAQLIWFIHQMQHLGFSPYGGTFPNQAQQSK